MKKRLLNDLKMSMKNKNIIEKNTIQLLRASILNKEKELQKELTNDEILTCVAAEIKQREKALKIYQCGGVTEKINETLKEISILKRYMPQPVSDSELSSQIDYWMNFFSPAIEQNRGKIIKEIKQKFGIRADGKRINEMLQNKLKERRE